MTTEVVSVTVSDDKKDVGETEPEIRQEEVDDQLDEDYEEDYQEDDDVEEGLEDNTLDGEENEEDLDGNDQPSNETSNNEYTTEKGDLDGNDQPSNETSNNEDSTEQGDLDGNDQPSNETSNNKDSTESTPIAANIAGGDASLGANDSMKEQMGSAMDSFKDARQQIGGLCQIFTSKNSNIPAAASQPQQPQPRRLRPQQKPQGLQQPQQKPQEVESETPTEQQPMDNVSTPQPRRQPQQRPKKQGQPRKKVSVAQQPQQQLQQKISVSPPLAQAQQEVKKVSDAPPNTQPQQLLRQRVSAPSPQAQAQQEVNKVSDAPPNTQPQQLLRQRVSASSPQAQAQQEVNKVSDAPPNTQPQQLLRQKVSFSPPQAQAQAQQEVNMVSDAPPNTQPQPQQQSETHANPSVREKGRIPSGVVDLPTPEEDATTLYTTFKGRGCDVARLVHVLSQRDATHRHLISQHYKNNYGEELSDRLSSELSSLGKGDLKEKIGVDITLKATGSLGRTFSSDIKRAISLWMLEESERDATIVWQAMQLTSFDKAAVTEVLCSRTPSQLRDIKRAYFTKFSSQLLAEITSSNFRFNFSHKELLIACLDDQARDEGTNVDLNEAEEDAKQLYKDGEKILGTNKKTFIDIFTKRNRPHLAAIDAAYNKLYGHSLEKAVEKETSGSFQDGLLTLLRCAKNPAKYFAEVLYNALKGVGTSDTTLIRTVVTRAEIDMEEIKKEYFQAYKKSLKDAIHKDTSGDYRTFLTSLVQ